jgi:hypothetical protein
MIAGSVVALPARAQTPTRDRPSHVPLPGGSDSPEMSLEAFKTRLDQIRLEQLLKEVAKDPKKFNLDPDKLKYVQSKNQQPPKLDLNDERFRELIQQLNQKYQGQPIEQQNSDVDERLRDDRILKRLEELANQAKHIEEQKNSSSTVGRPPSGGPGGTSHQPGNPPPSPPSGSPGPKGGPETPPPPEPPSKDEKEAKQEAKAMAELLEKFKDSPAMEKAIKAFTGEAGDDADTALGPDDVDDGLALERFGKDAGLDRLDRWLPKIDWDKLGGVKMPSHPDNWGPQAAPSAPSAPGFGGGGGPLVYGLLIIFVVGALIFVAWKLYGWWKEGIRFGAGGGWRLGPWPVQPALVRTREELVRAFEYLSLLRLGKPARNWNHRHIADRLGEVKTLPAGRVEAAERLAALYEHARYAPAADAMADQQMEAARRDLCFLAGVAGA